MRTPQPGHRSGRRFLLGLLALCGCITEYSISDALETGGLVCEEGETVCVGDCVNLLTEPEHCGACGLECDANEVCEGGSCVTACAPACDPTTELCIEDECLCRPPFELCGDGCVDTDSDFNHCGECGNECIPGQVCAGGECLADCGELSLCGADCVDTNIHTLHCGMCGEACGAEEVCLAGTCIPAIETEVECLECPCPGGCLFENFTVCCYDDFMDGPVCVEEGEC